MIPLAHPEPVFADLPKPARFLSDRRRVELALLALFIQRIARRAMDIEKPEHRAALLALDLACHEPFADLRPEYRARDLRARAWSLQNRMMQPYEDRTCLLATGVIGFWLIDRVDSGYINLDLDAPFAKVTEQLLEAARLHDEWNDRLERSARKNARRLQERLEREQYFIGGA